jgi:hypothetical protein
MFTFPVGAFSQSGGNALANAFRCLVDCAR